ncbi:MAG: type II toxin-antitoxin system VapC family toxin [Betaproteobacteria bacterium]|nr:type II toxin-antitoxin system VapC family toxin [Betaproteobacteria bacterium]
MSVLLDTVVLSELRKNKPAAPVLRWVRAQKANELFVSVVSIGEIERGIEIARKSDPAFAQELSRWLETLLTVYGDHVLPVTAIVARRWGHLSAKLGNDGADILIAATALTHGLAVATRNVKHFTPAGVSVVNPFEL